MEELIKKLAKIQQELTCKKGQTNKFGNYKYRSCEDILEAVKPLLGELVLTLGDKIVKIGDRYYVKAQATLSDGTNNVEILAYAREAEIKKGMDVSQITGATSSYARKYALNGLFAIDDTKDADTQDNTTEKAKPTDSDLVCSICGTKGKISYKRNKLGTHYCPNWTEHKEKGEKNKMIPPFEYNKVKTQEEIDFDKMPAEK